MGVWGAEVFARRVYAAMDDIRRRPDPLDACSPTAA